MLEQMKNSYTEIKPAEPSVPFKEQKETMKPLNSFYAEVWTYQFLFLIKVPTQFSQVFHIINFQKELTLRTHGKAEPGVVSIKVHPEA
jgi:hypothetical protein